MGWNVGNGESIKVWGETWLSSDTQLAPMRPPTLQNQQLRVKDLMLPNSTNWYVEEIRLQLPLYEAHIRKLVPSAEMLDDELVWLPEKSGQYSTRSGYALAKVHNCNQQDPFNWKRYVWNVECSPKLRQFLWKVKNEALAVGENLIRRGIQVDGKCKRCGETETIFHVMFSCPTARKVWDQVPAMAIPTVSSCNSMEDLLKLGSRMINLPPSGLTIPLYPWIFWVLWTSRNQLMFEDKSFSETEMVLKAIKAAKEWQESLPQRKQRSASSKDCHTSNPLSQVPTNLHIVYSDAAWNSSTGAGGLSWIGTDAVGSDQFQGTDTRRYIASALVAEALALKAGLS